MNSRAYIPSVLNKTSRFTGVELGVAAGDFSKELLQAYPMIYLFSVDAWAGDRGHDETEYLKTVQRLMPYKERNTILRTWFEQAVLLFPEEYFDFVYIDGYAHTGQDNGNTLEQWFPLVKSGGIMSGHDYSDRFPLTKKVVDAFCAKYEYVVNIVEEQPFASWYIIKR